MARPREIKIALDLDSGKFTTGIKGSKEALSGLNVNINKVDVDVKKLSSTLTKINTNLAGSKKSFGDMKAINEALISSIIALNTNLDKMSNAAKKAAASQDKLGSSGKKTKNYFDMQAKGMKHFLLDLQIARSAFENLNYFVISWSKAMVGSAIETQRNIKMLEGLSTALDDVGRKKEAAQNIEYLMDTAKKAPYSFGALTNSFAKFTAVGLDDTKGMLNSLTEASAHAGATDEQFKRASVAIAQMASKGVVSMEELRQQLAEAVPTAAQDMARAIGMDMQTMIKHIEKGELNAKVALKALSNLWGKEYAGSAAKMMETTSGQISQLKTNFAEFAMQFSGLMRDGSMAKGGLLDVVTEQIKELNRWMSSTDGRSFAQSMGQNIGVAIKFVGDLVKALGGLDNIITAVSYAVAFFSGRMLLGSLAGAIGGTIKGLRVFNSLLSLVTTKFSFANGAAFTFTRSLATLNGGFAKGGMTVASFSSSIGTLATSFLRLLAPIAIISTAIAGLFFLFDRFWLQYNRTAKAAKLLKETGELDQKEVEDARKNIRADAKVDEKGNLYTMGRTGKQMMSKKDAEQHKIRQKLIETDDRRNAPMLASNIVNDAASIAYSKVASEFKISKDLDQASRNKEIDKLMKLPENLEKLNKQTNEIAWKSAKEAKNPYIAKELGEQLKAKNDAANQTTDLTGLVMGEKGNKVNGKSKEEKEQEATIKKARQETEKLQQAEEKRLETIRDIVGEYTQQNIQMSKEIEGEGSALAKAEAQIATSEALNVRGKDGILRPRKDADKYIKQILEAAKETDRLKEIVSSKASFDKFKDGMMESISAASDYSFQIRDNMDAVDGLGLSMDKNSRKTRRLLDESEAYLKEYAKIKADTRKALREYDKQEEPKPPIAQENVNAAAETVEVVGKRKEPPSKDDLAAAHAAYKKSMELLGDLADKTEEYRKEEMSMHYDEQRYAILKKHNYNEEAASLDLLALKQKEELSLLRVGVSTTLPILQKRLKTLDETSDEYKKLQDVIAEVTAAEETMTKTDAFLLKRAETKAWNDELAETERYIKSLPQAMQDFINGTDTSAMKQVKKAFSLNGGIDYSEEKDKIEQLRVIQQKSTEDYIVTNKLGTDKANEYRAQQAAEFARVQNTIMLQASAAKDPIAKMMNGWMDLQGNLREATAQWTGELVDGLIEGNMAGDKFFKSILQYTAKLILQMLIARAVMSFLPGGNAAAVAAPSPGGSQALGASLSRAFTNINANHTGRRLVNPTNTTYLPSAFSDAIKLHSGGMALAAHEIPAILKEGERVLNPQETKDYNTVMSGLAKQSQPQAPNVSVNIINESGTKLDSKQQGSGRFDGEQYIIDVVVNAAGRPGAMRSALQGVNQ